MITPQKRLMTLQACTPQIRATPCARARGACMLSRIVLALLGARLCDTLVHKPPALLRKRSLPFTQRSACLPFSQ